MAIPPDKSPDRITPGQSLGPTDKPITPGQAPSGFESYMEGTGQAKTPPGTSPQQANGPNPMEIARGPSVSSAGVSFDSLLAQAKTTQDTLGSVEQQMKNPKLKLKRSQSHLVKQKLGDASSYVRAAASKLGLQLPEEKIPAGLTGLSRFIAMVNDGQDQIAQVQKKLKEMSAKGQQVSPADMMSIQVKMGLAQQEIEYTSTLLSKVIQSLTQIMNTQL